MKTKFGYMKYISVDESPVIPIGIFHKTTIVELCEMYSSIEWFPSINPKTKEESEHQE